LLLLLLLLFTAIGFSPGGSGYFTCVQNMKLATTKFKSGGLHEKHVVATWNLGNHFSILILGTGKPTKTCVEVAGRIYACAVKPYGTLKVKNALVKYVFAASKSTLIECLPWLRCRWFSRFSLAGAFSPAMNSSCPILTISPCWVFVSLQVRWALTFGAGNLPSNVYV